MAIGKMEVVPIREAFPHEAQNFTMWLEDNIEALSERLPLELTVLEREKAVGSFTVDLFCEDDRGETVIIENQLERTNHDHLGKLLTYMVNLDSKSAIWIATEIRQEHLRVIGWLNESTSADMAFYAVQVEAVRIGDSPYAPLFTVLAQPDEQIREIGEQKKELAERHYLREDFWTGLIERSREYTNLLRGRTPGRDHWYGIGAGKSGCNLNFLIFTDHAAIDLYLDTGNYETNKYIFDALYAESEAIISEFGCSLEWRRMDDKRASRIVHRIDSQGSLQEQNLWSHLQEIMIERMILFDKAIRKRVKKIIL